MNDVPFVALCVTLVVLAIIILPRIPQRSVRPGDRVRIVEGESEQNAFVGEVGHVVARGNQGYFVDLGDIVVPFDDDEVELYGWWWK